MRQTRNRLKNALKSVKGDRDASKHLTQHQQHLENKPDCCKNHQAIVFNVILLIVITISNMTMTRYWTYVKEEKVNCFLKGDKAETVRKPKYVSGSISKVLYHGYHVSKLDLCRVKFQVSFNL